MAKQLAKEQEEERKKAVAEIEMKNHLDDIRWFMGQRKGKFAYENRPPANDLRLSRVFVCAPPLKAVKKMSKQYRKDLRKKEKEQKKKMKKMEKVDGVDAMQRNLKRRRRRRRRRLPQKKHNRRRSKEEGEEEKEHGKEK